MFKSFIEAVKLMFTGNVKHSFEDMVLQEAIQEKLVHTEPDPEVAETKPKRTRKKAESTEPKKTRTKKNK